MKFKIGQEVKFNAPSKSCKLGRISFGIIDSCYKSDTGEYFYRIFKTVHQDVDDLSSDGAYVRSECHLDAMNECISEKKRLWRFHWDCGRSGEVEGLFCATSDEVLNKIGSTCCLGEVLGKHSDVHGTLEESDLTLIELPQEEIVIDAVCGILGDTWSGFNPLNYCRCECVKCGDDYMPDEMIDVVCYGCRRTDEEDLDG